jgi:hypothetical protein
MPLTGGQHRYIEIDSRNVYLPLDEWPRAVVIAAGQGYSELGHDALLKIARDSKACVLPLRQLNRRCAVHWVVVITYTRRKNKSSLAVPSLRWTV